MIAAVIALVSALCCLQFFFHSRLLHEHKQIALFFFYLVLTPAALFLNTPELSIEYILLALLGLLLFDYFQQDTARAKRKKMTQTLAGVLFVIIIFAVIILAGKDGNPPVLLRIIVTLSVAGYFLYQVVLNPGRWIQFMLFALIILVFGISRFPHSSKFLLLTMCVDFVLSIFENVNAIEEEFNIFKRVMKERVDLVHSISSHGAENKDFSQVLETLLNDLRQRFQLEGLAVYLKQDEMLVPTAVTGTFPAQSPHQQVSGIKHIKEIVLTERITDGLLVECVNQNQKKTITDRPDFVDLGIRIAVFLPIGYKNDCLGVLGVSSREEAALSRYEEELNLIRDQLGILIRFHGLYGEILTNAVLKEDVRLGAEIQKALLPDREPEIEGLEVKSFYRAARELGGDYYDFIYTAGGNFGACVADVSGKGIGASMVMAIYRVLLRVVSREVASPSDVFLKVATFLRGEIPPDMFVTGICAVYDSGRKKIIIANSGHNYQLLFKAKTGEVRELKIRGVAIGSVSPAIFDRLMKNEEFDFEPGDVLFLYSDGLTEAMNRDSNEYGLERMVRVFKAYSRDRVESLVKKLVDDVEKFVSGMEQSDDITMIAIRKK